MNCSCCEFYKSGYMYNACALTESEYFHTQTDCNLVNDDGSVNYENEYFKGIVIDGNIGQLPFDESKDNIF